MEYRVRNLDLTLGTYLGTITGEFNNMYIVYLKADKTIERVENSRRITLIKK